MAVYQSSGNSYELANDAPVTVPATVYNNVTGQQGVKFLRLLNTSETEVANVTWTLESTVYTFTGVAIDDQGAQLGSGATFNVTITWDNNTGLGVYGVTVANPGSGYEADAGTVAIYKESLGGATSATASNLGFDISEVDEDGGVAAVASVAGAGAWPQATTGSTRLLPLTEAAVQVLPSTDSPDGLVLLSPTTLPVYAEVVNVIG